MNRNVAYLLYHLIKNKNSVNIRKLFSSQKYFEDAFSPEYILNLIKVSGLRYTFTIRYRIISLVNL